MGCIRPLVAYGYGNMALRALASSSASSRWLPPAASRQLSSYLVERKEVALDESWRSALNVKLSFRNTQTHFGLILWLAARGPRRGSKEDLIIIVNNTKTHRPTIILGNTLGIANLHGRREEPRKRQPNVEQILYIICIFHSFFFSVLNR